MLPTSNPGIASNSSIAIEMTCSEINPKRHSMEILTSAPWRVMSLNKVGRSSNEHHKVPSSVPNPRVNPGRTMLMEDLVVIRMFLSGKPDVFSSKTSQLLSVVDLRTNLPHTMRSPAESSRMNMVSVKIIPFSVIKIALPEVIFVCVMNE